MSLFSDVPNSTDNGLSGKFYRGTAKLYWGLCPSKKGLAMPLSPSPLLHFPWSAAGSRFLISLAKAATVWLVSSNNTAVEMA